MEINAAWLNLPVQDLEASEKFYDTIGFTIKKHKDMMNKMRGIQTKDGQIIMLIEKEQFENVSRLSSIGSNEALVSLSVSTKPEVDTLVSLVEQAGGKVLETGTEHEGYYGALFSDIDGHLFNVIVM
ncbi:MULTISPECIES: VOC family protein [Staphylococcus]|nr:MULTISPECIES: VOC family protein [Staphylococcus]AQM41154.1 glyoxalase [Staphylococcus cohnii]SCS24986.1 glyoxalase [Staphylococcus cohnii subsp. cohnii]MBM9448283.1 VOC family protein [Staphylococcus ureilyticus]MCQ9294074.1 VOC family protein [Staphylococcus cohnii]MDQ7111379.1 VOC family protein [Staphylococcus ureilyticus]